MAINTTLEALSDNGFGAAAAAYTVALICSAVEFSSRRTAATRSAGREYATVGAPGALLTRDGTPGGVPIVPIAGAQAGIGHIGRVGNEPKIPWGERFGKAGLLVTILGFAAHVFSIVTRGMSAGRMPLGNMYEFTSLICATVIGVWLAVKLRQRALGIGVFVLIPVVLLMYVAGAILHTPAAVLQPALNSYWKWIHVTTISISSGILLFSGVASVLYIVRTRWEVRGARPDSVWAKLPEPATLDRIAYRTAILAFPLFTFAVITGALWAEVAWGRYWNWDPKETCAFITWVIYAGYLHARSTAGWRGTKSAWISVVGFASMMFNLFFVNMVISGLHSYAGLN